MTRWCIWYDSHRRLNGTMKRTFYVAVYFFCDMTHSHVWRDLFLCVTWRIHMCDMTHSHVWHDAHRRFNGEMKATPCRSMPLLCTHTCRWVRAAGVWGMSDWCVWHNSLIWGTWLIGMCGMSHWYVWHDSFICVTWLIHMCDMTHWYVWHDSVICVAWIIHTSGRHLGVSNTCVTWLIDTCGMSHWYVWHATLICVTWLRHMTDTRVFQTHVWHVSSIKRDMTDWYVWHDPLRYVI